MTAAKQAAPSARRHGFPVRYKALSNPAEAAWLASEEADDCIRGGLVQTSKVYGEVRRLAECRRRAARRAPSPSLLACYDTGQPYPPPARDPDRPSRRVLVRRADKTLNPEQEAEHLFPTYYFTSSDHYWELHLYMLFLIAKDDPVAAWVREQAQAADKSPSAEVHQELANRNDQIVEEKLDSEEIADLLKEIKSFHAGTWAPVDLSARSPRRRRGG
jgi:hypothetical protein